MTAARQPDSTMVASAWLSSMALGVVMVVWPTDRPSSMVTVPTMPHLMSAAVTNWRMRCETVVLALVPVTAAALMCLEGSAKNRSTMAAAAAGTSRERMVGTAGSRRSGGQSGSVRMASAPSSTACLMKVRASMVAPARATKSEPGMTVRESSVMSQMRVASAPSPTSSTSNPLTSLASSMDTPICARTAIGLSRLSSFGGGFAEKRVVDTRRGGRAGGSGEDEHGVAVAVEAVLLADG